MVKTENPILFSVASKHYKYGGFRLKFGLHFKYENFCVKIWAFRGPIQDDQGTQLKGTCEGDRWPGFSLFAKFAKEKN